MLGGLGGMDPKRMNQMMKQLGIKQEEIEATKVVIHTPSSNIVIQNPSVQKITMQGQESWQITGHAVEEVAGVSEDDIQLVMEKTGKSHTESKEALESTGDIAEAIMKLS